MILKSKTKIIVSVNLSRLSREAKVESFNMTWKLKKNDCRNFKKDNDHLHTFPMIIVNVCGAFQIDPAWMNSPSSTVSKSRERWLKRV